MAKTILTVEIEYDERVTDPEALASAADRVCPFFRFCASTACAAATASER